MARKYTPEYPSEFRSEAVRLVRDSGRSAPTLGGDVIGLSRGMMAAGVRRSIVSLWPVHDIVACCLMDAFHRRLVRLSVPARALFEAQAEIRQMSGDDILARYRSLGGETDARRSRSAQLSVVRAPRQSGAGQYVSDGGEYEMAALSGALPQNWAPLILIGG